MQIISPTDRSISACRFSTSTTRPFPATGKKTTARRAGSISSTAQAPYFDLITLDHTGIESKFTGGYDNEYGNNSTAATTLRGCLTIKKRIAFRGKPDYLVKEMKREYESLHGDNGGDNG